MLCEIVMLLNDSVMDQLVDVIHMNLDVLGSLPLNWINRYLNGPLIVTKYDSRKWILNTKLGENPPQPNNLCSCIHYTSILYLCCK